MRLGRQLKTVTVVLTVVTVVLETTSAGLLSGGLGGLGATAGAGLGSLAAAAGAGLGPLAGALALAGGLLIGKAVYYKKYDSYYGGYDDYGGGCGGCGGGCGWCGGGGGGYHRRRRRRSVEAFKADPQVERIYQQVALLDDQGCGLRLVCELAQKDRRTLARDEVLLLLPYRGAGPSNGSSFYSLYDEAAWHGQIGHNCSHEYPRCSATAQTVMEAFRAQSNLVDTQT